VPGDSGGDVRWLHQLVVVMHLIITLRAGAGVRLVCEFLELSGLSAVVGASYGSQYTADGASAGRRRPAGDRHSAASWPRACRRGR
jgi:hypothetical protein